MSPVSQAQNDYIEQVVEAYADILLRVALHHSKTLADAQDAVQSVFVKLMTKAPLFESKEHEKAWLIRVTVNHCRDVLRSGWSSRTGPLPEQDSLLLCSEDNPDGLTVLEAVRSLPAKYRAPVYLYYYEGYTTAEIAQMLGVRPGTIDSRLFRARQKLQQLLKGVWG